MSVKILGKDDVPQVTLVYGFDELMRLTFEDALKQFPMAPTAAPRLPVAKDPSKVRASVMIGSGSSDDLSASGDLHMRPSGDWGTSAGSLSASSSNLLLAGGMGGGSMNGSMTSLPSAAMAAATASTATTTGPVGGSVVGGRRLSMTPAHNAPPTFPPFNYDLLLRSVKGEVLQPADVDRLHRQLLERTRKEAVSYLDKAYWAIEELACGPQAMPGSPTMGADGKRKMTKLTKMVSASKDKLMAGAGELSCLKITKRFLDFGLKGATCPVNKELSDEFTITCLAGKPKFQWIIPPAKSHSITIDPPNGTLKKKQSIAIKAKLIVRAPCTVQQVITLELEGEGRYHILLKVSSQKSIFGSDYNEIELIEEDGLRIPSVLISMRNYLYEKNGRISVGIFRLAGDDVETLDVKDQLNSNCFELCQDVNCVATLIKVWFRELPLPVLNAIPPSSFLAIEQEDECLAVFEELPEPQKSLMIWLLDLLSDIAVNESVNKMTPKNLAIVVAPNLFSTTDVNPVESLMLSQKIVNFCHHTLVYRLRMRYDVDSTTISGL